MKTFKLFPGYLIFTLFCVTEMNAQKIISESDFNKFYHAVESENFSNGKMQTLKTSSNFHLSFTCEQVKSLALLFNMDNDKFECVKCLTPKVADVQNLPYVKDVFTFESTRNSYLKFLDGIPVSPGRSCGSVPKR